MITQPGKFRAPQYGKPVAARDEVRELPKKQFSQSIVRIHLLDFGSAACARQAQIFNRTRESAMIFQLMVRSWMHACFGAVIPADKVERNHRFLEEALELVQAAGCTKEEALKLVDYVYGRPKGELHQEIGGVMVTLAALTDAHGADMVICGEVELRRCWDNIMKIREKQAAKPKMSVTP